MMTFSLYQATIPSFQQTIGAAIKLLDKAEAFCGEAGLEPVQLVDSKLADDMLPFGYQVKSICAHSAGAIKGVHAGVFSPDMTPWPKDIAGLKTALTSALADIDAVSADDLNGLVGRDMAFVMGERRMDFTAEDFLMSFSLPNFYFHATTAYAILRWKGVKIGKMDYMGRPRLKG
jgi:uncharacterized protein